MMVDVKAICRADIESDEAFRILCKTLYMDFALNDEIEYFIKENEWGEKAVYRREGGCERCIDDRGDLFIALRNVAVNMFPNLGFRSADYIYKE